MSQPESYSIEAPKATLMSEEILLAVWRPSFQVYLTSKIAVSCLTIVTLGSPFIVATFALPLIGLAGQGILEKTLLLLDVLFALVLSGLFYSFIFDDYIDWNRAKNTVWFLTDRRIIVENSGDKEDVISTPLKDIRSVGRFLWWRVFLKLQARTLIEISYVPNIKKVQNAIKKARQVGNSAERLST